MQLPTIILVLHNLYIRIFDCIFCGILDEMFVLIFKQDELTIIVPFFRNLYNFLYCFCYFYCVLCNFLLCTMCMIFYNNNNNNMLAYKVPVCQKTSEAP